MEKALRKGGVCGGWGWVLSGGSMPSAEIFEELEDPEHSDISIILGSFNHGLLETTKGRL